MSAPTKTPEGIMQAPPESFRRPGDPPAYEIQRRIMAGLDAAQERWCRETGARLEVLWRPPPASRPGAAGRFDFRYTREHLPPPVRTGETVRERPVRDGAGRVVARVLIREHPDGSTAETCYDLQGREIVEGEVIHPGAIGAAS